MLLLGSRVRYRGKDCIVVGCARAGVLPVRSSVSRIGPDQAEGAKEDLKPCSIDHPLQPGSEPRSGNDFTLTDREG